MLEQKWNTSLEIGVEVIDSQHRSLVDLVNQLQAAALEPQSIEKLRAIFGQLERYSRYHFEEEEKLMREIGFEFYTAHVAEHDQMRKELSDLHEVIDNAEVALGEVIPFLVQWLTNHICGSDSLIGESIRRKKKGATPAASEPVAAAARPASDGGRPVSAWLRNLFGVRSAAKDSRKTRETPASTF